VGIHTLSPNGPNGAAVGPPAPRTPRGLSWIRLLVVAAVLAVLSGCAANFGAQTQVRYQPGVGTDERNGDVYVLNAVVVADSAGTGTVVTNMISQVRDDYLTDFTASSLEGGVLDTSKLPAVTDGSANAPTDGVSLPLQTSVKLPDAALLQVEGPAVTPGSFVSLSLTFQEAAPLQLQVPVVSRSGAYSGIPVGPIATPVTPTASEATPSS
jgi:hypothetical protein